MKPQVKEQVMSKVRPWVKPQVEFCGGTGSKSKALEVSPKQEERLKEYGTKEVTSRDAT